LTTVPWSLARLGYALTIGSLTVVAVSPWLQGPTAVGLALCGGTAASGIIDDRMSKRTVAWGTAFAQGLILGITAWLTLRWISR
jgi:hypothetical protein